MRLIEVDALKETLDRIPARSIENADGRAYVLIRLSTVLEIIKQMPSVELEERTEERTETPACDCISRQAALISLEKSMNLNQMRERLKRLPSAEPQIIRCKDCTWWTNQSTTLQGKCRLHNLNPMPEWYCGSGEE